MCRSIRIAIASKSHNRVPFYRRVQRGLVTEAHQRLPRFSTSPEQLRPSTMNSRHLRRGLAPPRRGEFRSRRLDDTGFSTPVEEVNEVFASLHRNRDVVGVIATLSDGAVIKSTLPDQELTNRYAMMAVGLSSEARNTLGTGRRDRPTYFNVTNENHEIIVTPGRAYTLILVKQLHETPEDES
ncbi:hypothetical protein MTO96_011683 [Rhipicephalus appendiculatus]